jgi:hypothetical protein
MELLIENHSKIPAPPVIFPLPEPAPPPLPPPLPPVENFSENSKENNAMKFLKEGSQQLKRAATAAKLIFPAGLHLAKDKMKNLKKKKKKNLGGKKKKNVEWKSRDRSSDFSY